MSNVIQSSQQSAANSSQILAGSAQGLQQKTITADGSTNITAKSKAVTAYEKGQSQKASYRNALSQDAGHIAALGSTFEQLDASISAMLSSGF